MFMRSWKQLCAAAVVVTLAAPAIAQVNVEGVRESIEDTVIREGESGQTRQSTPETQQPRREQPVERATTRAGQRQGAQSQQLDDAALASWVLAGFESEQQISKTVAEKTQNEKVKAFAQKTIEEHAALAEKLRQVANASNPGQRSEGIRRQPTATQNPRINQARPAAAQPITQPGQRGTQPGEPTRQPAQPGNARAQQGQQSQNPAVALHEEIAEKCAQATVEGMRQAQPEQLNEWYVGQSLISHMNMKATLEVLEPKASPQLKPILAEASQAVEQHLQEAQQLMEELDQSQPESRPQSQPQSQPEGQP